MSESYEEFCARVTETAKNDGGLIIGEAAWALDHAGMTRVRIEGHTVDIARADETGRGWLDIHSDAACLGVRVEVDPGPDGFVWVVPA